VGSVISVPEVNQAALLTPATATTAPASGVRFGFQVRAVTDADVIPFGLVKPKGIVVVDVLKDGLADKMGFQPGDVILEVNDSEIGDLAFFTQFIHSGVVKNFRVWRKGQSLDLAMPQDM
jgi:S1-C subfamily serine protease